MAFDKNVIFGAAAASFQIEGAAEADGKGRSIWDVYCDRPGLVTEGHTGKIACDHYNRYKEDVRIMKQLALKAYRYSISWCRVMPDGKGAVNQKGLDFYDKLTDELLENGIEPYVTLFHWDYPQELMKRGGWMNPDSPKWFAEYSQVVVDKLSDRVKNWFTINEPTCFIGHGYSRSRHAPGYSLGLEDTLNATHNTLLGHGMAVSVIRDRAKIKPSIGFAPQGLVAYPDTPTPENIEAARQYMFAVRNGVINNSWWMDPIYLGEYPKDGVELFGKAMPEIGAEDMKLISQPLDFCGFNTYGGTPIIMGVDGKPMEAERPVGHPEGSREWSVDFDSLYWGAKYFYDRYKLPILLAENGVPTCDWISEDGAVHDMQRVDFLSRNLKSLEKAYDEGIPVHGYMQWSFMDNMEWYVGYTKRFGIVYVDYATQKRTIKDSGYWYRDFIKNIGTKTVPTDNENLTYYGRWEFKDGNAIGNWNRPYVTFDFSGTRLWASFGNNCDVIVNIDGKVNRYTKLCGETLLADNLKETKHTATITIANANSRASFNGLRIDSQAEVSKAEPKKYIQFIGDSITTSPRSFSHTIPLKYNYDYSIISMCGISLLDTSGWYHVLPTYYDLYDRNKNIGMQTAYFSLKKPEDAYRVENDKLLYENSIYDVANDREPDVITVFLGANDTYYINRNITGKGKDEFIKGYTQFLGMLCDTYKNAQVCVLPTFNEPRKDMYAQLNDAIETAVHNVSNKNLHLLSTEGWDVEFDADGTHPATGGYDALCDYVHNAIKQYI